MIEPSRNAVRELGKRRYVLCQISICSWLSVLDPL